MSEPPPFVTMFPALQGSLSAIRRLKAEGSRKLCSDPIATQPRIS
jgi:hypothetical protein